MSEEERNPNEKAERFLARLHEKGFKGCPICGNDEDFTWMQDALGPEGEGISMWYWVPGRTTLPNSFNQRGETTPYQIQSLLLVCDRCSYLMQFSGVHWRTGK